MEACGIGCLFFPDRLLLRHKIAARKEFFYFESFRRSHLCIAVLYKEMKKITFKH